MSKAPLTQSTNVILEVPYVYNASFKAYRARSAKPTRIRDQVAVLIKRVDDDTFPVAARYQTSYNQVSHLSVDELRYNGKDFFAPVCKKAVGKRDVFDQQMLIQSVTNISESNPFYRLQNIYMHREEFKYLRDLIGHIESDNQQKCIEEIEIKASELVFCNGQLFQKCGEPCFNLRSGNLQVDLLYQNQIKPDSSEHETYFRATMLEQFCAAHFKSRYEPYVSGILEVILPEAFKLNFGSNAIKTSTQSILKSLEHLLASASVEDFAQYALIRDQFKSDNLVVDDRLIEQLKNLQSVKDWKSYTDYRLANAIELYQIEQKFNNQSDKVDQSLKI